MYNEALLTSMNLGKRVFGHRIITVLFLSELTPEQQKTLIDIRRRKTELLLEIQVSGQFALVFNNYYLMMSKVSELLNTLEVCHYHVTRKVN